MQQMNVNTLKTTVFLAALGGLLVLVGNAFFGSNGLIIGLALGLGFCRRLLLVLGQAGDPGSQRSARHRAGDARELRHRPGTCPAGRYSNAPAIRLAQLSAKRVRDRP